MSLLRHRSALVVSRFVPDSSRSAAGTRVQELLSALKRGGATVQLAHQSPKGTQEWIPWMEERGIASTRYETRRKSRTESFRGILTQSKPDIVVFDTFTVEEQLSWLVCRECPGALRVLDTQDLHSLRKAREDAIKNNNASVEQSLETIPTHKDVMLLRELGAIHRSDLSIFVSTAEVKLLREHFGVPEKKMFRAPLLFGPRDVPEKKATRPFEARRHFVTLGSFRHGPNRDAVCWLKEEIWPHIRSRIPEAQCHVYGYAQDGEMSSLTDRQNGFLMRGFLPNLDRLSKYRVFLAPLRFGAGIKGKIIDSWAFGTPVATTPIGAEGMTWHDGSNGWGGAVSGTALGVAESAVEHYSNKSVWERSHSNGRDLLSGRFGRSESQQELLRGVASKLETLESDRDRDHVMAVLTWENLRSNENAEKRLV